MIRSVAIIAAAIRIANPDISEATARGYATTLQQTAKEHHFDPFTGVAIGWHETKWRPATTGGAGGKCHGLFQVCVQWAVPACKQSYESAACKRERTTLLDPHHAIRRLGRDITRWRKYCRRTTGKPALFARWLAGYQGVDAARGTTCNQRRTKRGWRDAPRAKMTRRVMAYRLKLIERLRR